MEYDQVMKVIDKFNNSKLTELNIEEGNFKISLKAEVMEKKVIPLVENSIEENRENTEVINLSENISEKSEPITQISNDNFEEIVCPLVGTFYSSKAEGEETFIKVGDKIEAGQVIGIVEAMKLMNEITATCSGIVEEILVQNEDLVEYGQVLVKVRA